MALNNFSSIVIAIGITGAGWFIQHVNTFQELESKPKFGALVSIIYNRGDDSYLFIKSKSWVPYKFLFGETLFKSTCLYKKPRIYWRNKSEVEIYCGVQNNFTIQKSVRVSVN